MTRSIEIVRADGHPATEETIQEILASLQDRTELRYLVLGRRPTRTSASTKRWWGNVCTLTFGISMLAIVWGVTLSVFHKDPPVPAEILKFSAMFALGMIVIAVVLYLVLSTVEKQRRLKVDESRAAFAIEEGRLHVVEVRDDRIDRTSYPLGERRSYRERTDSGLRYDLPYPDRHIVLAGLPETPGLDDILMPHSMPTRKSQTRIVSA